MWGQAVWPVTLECGDLVLRPIKLRDKAEWTRVRARNAAWLQPWEASNPVSQGQLPTFGGMVRVLNQQAREASALPFIITERVPTQAKPAIVGQLTVSSIMWGSAMSATLGYWVDQDRAGRGIVPTAVAMATDHCFVHWGCTGWRLRSVRRMPLACAWWRNWASGMRGCVRGICTSTANGPIIAALP